MKNNVKIQDDTQSLQSCVSVSVTDLRIGNLVIVDNEKYHPKLKDVVLEITEINESMDLDFKNSHGIGLKHINQKPYTYYERYSQLIAFIKPIPITEEWLFSFGFDFVLAINNRYLKDSGAFYFTIMIMNDDKSYQVLLSNHEKKEGEIIPVVGLGIIKYVHQLQNLYQALTGSEL